MQSGNRVLTPAEWACLSIGVAFLFDQVQADVDDETDEASTGVVVFDRLTAEQKMLILAEVTEALVKDVPSPKLTAVREATVAAMFASLEFMIGLEIEMGDTTARRALLVALADDPPEEIPDETCEDEFEWELTAECLETRILWDRDFEMDEVADMPPDVAAAVDASLQFGDGYFSAVAAEPDKTMLEAARTKLRALLR